MDLDTIKCFIAIAKIRNFTKAAESLYITQPSLSQKISKLERELNLELFDRKYHEVELTPVGELFLPHAKKIIAEYQDFTKEANNHELDQLNNNERQLRLGCLLTDGLKNLTNKLQTFAKLNKIQASIVELYSDQIIPALLAKKIDLGIGILHFHSKISWYKLFTDELVVITNSKNTNSRHYISESKLKNKTLLEIPNDEKVQFESVINQITKNDHKKIVNSSSALYANLLMNKNTFAITPENAVRQEALKNSQMDSKLTILKLKDLPLSKRKFNMGLAYRSDFNNPVVNAFLRFLKE